VFQRSGGFRMSKTVEGLVGPHIRGGSVICHGWWIELAWF
jgi:hypothetical protein